MRMGQSVNGNFMRPGQHKNNNNNRNRNRNNNNNRRNTGSGGGSSNNKVFDSNGPDVKLRGTTQTIAEKYMQMGRDAQSGGDSVAAENYYQHAEHYYRLWAASQPVGQSLIMSRKLGEEEFDEDGEEINADDEGEVGAVEGAVAAEGSEPVEGVTPENQQGENQQRNFRDSNNRNNNNRNNRPRWQNRRNERYDNNPQGVVGPDQISTAAPMADSNPVQVENAPAAVEASGQWEAPSFLQRPAPVATEPMSMADAVEDAPAPRRYKSRKPKAEADEGAAPRADVSNLEE